MTFEEFLSLEPRFHLDQHGEPISWGLASEVLSFLHDSVTPGDQTLETGAGLSTVTLALRGCRHTSICPSQREFDGIRSFCQEHGIVLDEVRLVVARSEFALPSLELQDLDLVLVDGRHAFPTPFIDWFYATERLKVGGLVAIDDTQLETGRILKEFMNEDHRWQRTEEIGKTVFFQKLTPDVHMGEWTDQPYVSSRVSSLTPNPNVS